MGIAGVDNDGGNRRRWTVTEWIFKVVPTIYYQLLTMFVPFADAAFPVVFALISRKAHALYSALFQKINKSSAVAEMGDRGHNRYQPKRGGYCAPFRERGLGSRLTRCEVGRGLPSYQVAS